MFYSIVVRLLFFLSGNLSGFIFFSFPPVMILPVSLACKNQEETYALAYNKSNHSCSYIRERELERCIGLGCESAGWNGAWCFSGR